MVVYDAMEGARDYVTLFILLGISGRFAQAMRVFDLQQERKKLDYSSLGCFSQAKRLTRKENKKKNYNKKEELELWIDVSVVSISVFLLLRKV